MGNVISTNIQGLGWKVRAGLVLLFALATAALFMPQGAEASVAAVNAWPATPQIVSNAATGTVTGTVTVGAGTNRVMLVVVGAEYTATPATQPITVTFGGQPVTQLQNNFAGPQTIWLGFLNEAGLAKASGTTLSVTNGNTTNLTAMYASAAVYSGIEQTNPISGSNSVSSGATAVTTLNLPLINVKGAAGNTALGLYISNRNLQASTPDAAYTENVEYLGTNFYMAFNTITTPPAALITTAPAVTTATASLGSAVSVGLVPAGVTTVGVIANCSECHGYPPVDGTARNVPSGQFQGSHSKHTNAGASQYAYVCTRCHVGNTVFDHENGSVDMAAPINGNTGASYSKGSSFAVSNAALTGGTCSNTYCHSNGTGGTKQSGDNRGIVANTSVAWGTARGNTYASNCSTTCHNGRPSYANYTSNTSITGQKANSHQATTHSQQTCDVCHNSVATTDAGVTYSTYSTHNNGVYNLKASLGYTFAVKGGTCATPGCHGSAKWGGQLGCINCHNVAITRTKGRPGATLAAVTTEFGLAWGHKKTGRGAVTNNDCVVCHLEGYGYGNVNAGKPNPTYHQNGNIDLRDPLGAGETPITNIGGAAFTFQRFSTTYAAGSRTNTGHTANTIDNVLTQKFCLGCHRSSGATNPTARTAGGTAYMPWGGVNLGATYTVANGAAVAGGVVNVFSQFSSGNSSYHPVRAPLNRDFPAATRLVAPYNNNGSRAGTSGSKTLSVVINCFDCHNVSATAPWTTRTVVAHGNATTIRGTIYTFGGVSTLCTTCHSGYTTTSGYHSTGSAWGATGSSHNVTRNCQDCHGTYQTTSTAPARPIRAQDYHGNNSLNGGGLWPTVNSRPYAFIRAWGGTAYHRPLLAKEFTTGSATCASGSCPAGGNGGQVGDGSTRTYTPGGSY